MDRVGDGELIAGLEEVEVGGGRVPRPGDVLGATVRRYAGPEGQVVECTAQSASGSRAELTAERIAVDQHGRRACGRREIVADISVTEGERPVDRGNVLRRGIAGRFGDRGRDRSAVDRGQ